MNDIIYNYISEFDIFNFFDADVILIKEICEKRNVTAF